MPERVGAARPGAQGGDGDMPRLLPGRRRERGSSWKAWEVISPVELRKLQWVWGSPTSGPIKSPRLALP